MGRLEAINKLGTSAPGQTNSFEFYVEVLGNDYKIRIKELKTSARSYEYTFHDGLMHILDHENGSVQSAERNVDGTFPARMEKRDIPPSDGTGAQFVWFALASHGFFLRLQTNYMSPIWCPEDPKTHKQPLQMMIIPEYLSENMPLPDNVTFINDGFYRSYNPTTKAVDVRPLVAPFDNGYNNAEYWVLARTNTMSYVLPLEFLFRVFSCPLHSGEMPFEKVTVLGRVTAVGDSVREGIRMSPFRRPSKRRRRKNRVDETGSPI